MNKKQLWPMVKLAAVFVSVLSFTPWVLSPGSEHPYILGMPFTLGIGILISISLIFLVMLGALVAPKVDDNQEVAP